VQTIYFLFVSVITLGIISALLLLRVLYKSTSKLPEGWKIYASMKNFKRSIYSLIIFLFVALGHHIINYYLTSHHLPSDWELSVYFTFATFFLVGFLFIHTLSRWKRAGIAVFYFILIGYLIFGGYYSPLCSHPPTSSLLLNSIFFLTALLHLTDLLMRPKTDHFRFKLKICLVVLISALMANILTSFYRSDITSDKVVDFPFVFLLQIGNLILFYVSFPCIFIAEIIKFRRV
jgi:hypothetical protein